MKKAFLSFFLFTTALFAKWNNDYSFFKEGGNSSAVAALNILSDLLTLFGAYVFLHSLFKLLASDSPEDRTRGAIFLNVIFLILGLLFVANRYVILSILGVR